jgi:hypothetical protein
VQHIYFTRDEDTYIRIMSFVKNRAYHNKLDLMEIHSFTENSNFATSRAVLSLIKFGYFSLYRLKTRTVKSTVTDEVPRHVLVVSLKRTDNFDSLYEAFREEGKVLYQKKLEAIAAAKGTTEEAKEGGEGTDPPGNEQLKAEASEEDSR